MAQGFAVIGTLIWAATAGPALGLGVAGRALRFAPVPALLPAVGPGLLFLLP